MSLLWPRHVAAQPGLQARVGRWLHWTGLVLAALWLVACVWTAVRHPGADWSDGYLIGMFLVPPLCFYACGRAARHVLSGE